MKLLTFALKENEPQVGFLLDKQIVDIAACRALLPKSLLPEKITMKALLEPIVLEELMQLRERLLKMKATAFLDFEKATKGALYELEEVQIKAPLYDPQKIICLGRNYAEHAKEGGAEVPKTPMIWGKFSSAIIGHKEAIILPKISKKVDVEIELVIVIGKEGKHIPEEKAFEYIAGFTIGNDVSARDYQYIDKQFTRAKTMDTFCPLGPWIVTKEEIPPPQNLNIELQVNGKTWQKSNTSKMIFSIPYIVSYLSHSFTFQPGDLIFTGTPSGVGHYQKPPVYLKEGDIVTLTIEGIGTLENPVRSEE
ncbi:MAG: fumarylacetoacetate hydrolase family protein [Candidatus Heimdallarchaeota archaeon]|nr:fumarylacetoacetate hydrolase family protein [Candidatus Heimdallarchaeota archaeon]